MVVIDKISCIGCGQCEKDCFGHNISMKEGKAHIIGNCFECGHCVAICPVNAAKIQGDIEDEIQTGNRKAEEFLNLIKNRRSIRYYKDQPVSNEQIQLVLEAGRYTPTAGNAQGVTYTVVSKKLPEVKPYIWRGLLQFGKKMKEIDPDSMYDSLWSRMYTQCCRTQGKEDHLFFNAPILLIVAAKTSVNGILAADSVELMANTLGLGCLYSGFIERGLKESSEALELLNLKKEDICICMLMGYPDISYQRPAPRKPAVIYWK